MQKNLKLFAIALTMTLAVPAAFAQDNNAAAPEQAAAEQPAAEAAPQAEAAAEAAQRPRILRIRQFENLTSRKQSARVDDARTRTRSRSLRWVRRAR